MAEAVDYPPGAVKQDPHTGILAQRNEKPGDHPEAWKVLGRFQHVVPHEDVAHWVDLGPLP